MGDREIKILCYTDDTVLVAENKDDLQRLLHEFNINTKKINMKIPAQKKKV